MIVSKIIQRFGMNKRNATLAQGNVSETARVQLGD